MLFCSNYSRKKMCGFTLHFCCCLLFILYMISFIRFCIYTNIWPHCWLLMVNSDSFSSFLNVEKECMLLFIFSIRNKNAIDILFFPRWIIRIKMRLNVKIKMLRKNQTNNNVQNKQSNSKWDSKILSEWKKTREKSQINKTYDPYSTQRKTKLIKNHT